MAKTSLRVYTHEIEEMIEHNQFDQAIAHCRNILQYYPKHINTYRLLGKAFLESQRYGDAGDIFQRILSSFPEDFVSHVGMSIIREDEGNLDDSLWHMERAFEMQPSNNAIQGELRRLHGKLEGTEPSKIRLTRGALAHMYIRGDLLSQAIAELRIALTEDSSRFDLQTILAKAYHQSGQLAEAAKICNTLLEKLPYNFEANRILTEIYKKSDRLQEAETYQQRLVELDPYFAFVNEKTPAPEQVNDSAVTVEQLDWKPGFSSPEISAQPEWAKSIGVSMDSPSAAKESMPDWFSTTEETPIIPSQPMPPIIEIKEEESQIPSTWEPSEPISEQISTPDWASPEERISADDSSFLQAVEEVEEEQNVFSKETGASKKDVSIEAEELAPADIPEWLRALKPQTSNLEGKLPPAVPIPSEPPKEKEFSWLDESTSEAEEKWSPPEKEEEKIPFNIPSEEKPQIADWLHEAEESVTPEIEAPQPIQGLDQFTPQPVEEYISETVKEENNKFSWLSEDTNEQIPEEPLQKESTLWGGETEEELLTVVGADNELPPAEEVELPEWLAEMKREADQNPTLIKPSETIPDWVQNLEEPPISEEDTKPTKLAQQVIAQEPQSFTSEQYPEAAIFGAPEIDEYEETIPSSIFEEKEFVPEEEPPEIRPSDFTKAVEAEAQSDWLTEMEAQEQYEQSIFQEEKPEIPPEWVSGNLIEEEGTISTQEEAESLEEVQLPDWLTEMAPKTGEEIKPQAEEKPVWLSEYETEPSQIEELEEPVPSMSDFYETPELSLEENTGEAVEEYSLEGLAEQGIFEENEKTEEKETLPDWLLEYEEGEPTESIAEPTPKTLPVSEPPAWFEQPDELSKFEIPFNEEPFVEESHAIEEQLLDEKTSSDLFELENRSEFEAQEELPVTESSIKESPFAEAIISDTIAGATPFMEIPEEELPGDTTPVEEIPTGEMLVEEAPVEEITAEELPVETAPLEEIPVEELPVEAAPLEEISAEELPIETAPVEEIPVGELPVEAAPVEEIPAVELPVETAPLEEIPAEELPTEEAPVEEITAEELPVEAAPEEEIPSEELPVEAAPVEEIPSEELPVETTPVEEIPSEELPVETAPLEEITAEELPVETAPVEEITAEELPAEAAPVEEIPAEELHVEAAVVEEIPTEELPLEEAPIEETREEELPTEETISEEKPIPIIKAPVTRMLGEEKPGEEIPQEAEIVLIDLNQASLIELERIPGVGFIKAQNIINFRLEHGAFTSVEDLSKVSGFDEALVNSIKTRVAVFVSHEEPAQVLVEEEIQTPLLIARDNLEQGRITEAVSQYSELIKTNTNLDEIAYDLQVAIDQYPTDSDLWQTLGDTCVRLGKLQDALNAYTQAEKLVR